MYNYLRELHRLFDTQPDHTEEHQQLELLAAVLREHLGNDERKLLLELIDTRDSMDYEISLESFAAGFRLAYGLTRELENGSRYSYEEAETSRLCQNHNS